MSVYGSSEAELWEEQIEEKLEKYVLFDLEGETYCLPILKIQEIIANHELTLLPNLPEFYHGVISAFAEQTGCPVIINTSFNVRGEPIVCTPEDAYHCFMGTDMDVLVLENFILLKQEQPQTAVPDRDQYLAQFELD